MRNYRMYLMLLMMVINYMTAIAMFNYPPQKMKSFSHEEQEVIQYCNDKDILNLGHTNKSNYAKVHDLIYKKHEILLADLEKTILVAPNLEEKIKILSDYLRLIKEQYIQKKDAHYRTCQNKNPNIKVIENTISFVSHHIAKEMIEPLNSSDNERYAIVLGDFLLLIKRNNYIPQKDKKNIYKLIPKNVKRLKLPYYRGMSIKKLCEKKKYAYCSIL